MIKKYLATALVAGSLTAGATSSQAGVSPYLGDLMYVGFPFCPRGWIDAHGQLLAISQYEALFSLYGTVYGGDGRTTFAMPDLRSRTAVGEGTGSGLANVRLGQKGGTETTAIGTSEMPSHYHALNHVHDTAAPLHTMTLNGSSQPQDVHSPEGGTFGTYGASATVYRSGDPDGGAMASEIIKVASSEQSTSTAAQGDTTKTGSGHSFDNIMPTLGIRACVSTIGTYPPRN